jgi:hypothetical protein
MIRTLSHTSFSITAVAADVRPCASAGMTETGLTVAKDPNPNALALRHAP